MLQLVNREMERMSDPDAIWQRLTEVTRDRGYWDAFYLHIPPAGLANTQSVFHYGGCETAPQYMADQTFLIDPFVAHATQTVRPFQMRDVCALRKLSDEEGSFLAVLEANTYADGLAMPLYGPNGRSGYLELKLAPGHPEIPETEMRELHWLAMQAHLRICDLVTSRHERQELTPREVEILQWLAQGKSNDVIGQILGLSPHTIDTHLRRIYAKLEVCDRVSAALRGVGEGLVTGVAPGRRVTKARSTRIG